MECLSEVIGRNAPWPRVSRHRVPIRCRYHGLASDVTVLCYEDGRTARHCTACLAEASDYQPWFYDNSPHGADIARIAQRFPPSQAQ